MSLIQVDHLSFTYDGSYDPVFEDVSFQLDTDWRLGFIGRNGRGKTTFLRLLMGHFAHQGSIGASVEFEYFPYPVADPGRDTLEVLSEVHSGFELWELQRELGRLGVDDEALWRPFSTLSNGEQTKALIAVMFLKENAFLLIDEPTNHLDEESRRRVGRYLAGKKGFILISHDRAVLDLCIDHVLSINKEDIQVQRGNFSTWYENKQREDAYETEQNQRLRGEIRRLSQTAREKSDWSDRVEATKIGTHCADRGRVGHLAAKMMKRSKAIEQRAAKAVEEKSKLLKNIDTADSLKIHPLAYHSKRLAEFRDVSIHYDGRTVCGPVSFVLEQGQRLALCGKNGCGKSSLLRLLLGEEVPHTGEVYRGSGLKLSYVRQDTSGLQGSLADFEQQEGIDPSLFRAILRKLDFSRTQFEKDMGVYSAGQKKKVLLARSLCERAHLYLWDEPLNFIDVLSRIQIQELLTDAGATMLLVEHDSAFLDAVVTARISL